MVNIKLTVHEKMCIRDRFKGEKLITSPQGAKVKLEDGRELLNMCANNYLEMCIRDRNNTWQIMKDLRLNHPRRCSRHWKGNN